MSGQHAPTVTAYTPGHLYFDDPTFDAKVALKGRKTVYGQPYVVAHVNRPNSARDGDDKRYARMFCAAPAMLEALKPFADVLADVGEDEDDADLYQAMSPQHRRAPAITVGHLRAAFAAIATAAGSAHASEGSEA